MLEEGPARQGSVESHEVRGASCENRDRHGFCLCLSLLEPRDSTLSLRFPRYITLNHHCGRCDTFSGAGF